MKPILKPLKFVGSSQDDLRDFPEAVRRAIGTEFEVVQFGGTPTDFKPMSSVGAGAYEVRVRTEGAWRAPLVKWMSPSLPTPFTFCMRFKKRLRKPAKPISTSLPPVTNQSQAKNEKD